jgi:hypothetical protein
MTGDDPRRQLRMGGDWERMDRPPGWADSLFAGRSQADREADQDAMLRVLLVLGGIAVLLIVALNALFTMVGLQLGWWSVPAFAPLLFWSFACALCNRVLRPVEIDVLSWRRRVALAEPWPKPTGRSSDSRSKLALRSQAYALPARKTEPYRVLVLL